MSRLLAFGLILICCQIWVIGTNGNPLFAKKYEERNNFEKFLEDFREILRTGNDSLGIPKVDPLIIDNLPIEIDEEMLKMTALLKDIDVRGLSAYEVNKGNIEIIGFKATVNLTWPLVGATLKYEMKGKAGGDLDIFGKGDIQCTANGFDIGVIVFLTVKDNYLYVKSIESDMALNQLQFKITGLLDDEEISEVVSGIVTDMVPQLIRDYPNEIKQVLHPIIQEQLDSILQTKTLLEWLEILT